MPCEKMWVSVSAHQLFESAGSKPRVLGPERRGLVCSRSRAEISLVNRPHCSRCERFQVKLGLPRSEPHTQWSVHWGQAPSMASDIADRGSILREGEMPR